MATLGRPKTLIKIRDWWRRWPDALIGAVIPPLLMVLDIDPRNGGSLAGLESIVGPLPATFTAWSGRNDGGRHLYFFRPQRQPLVSTRLPNGIDLKTNGYMIMPPSLHPATGQPLGTSPGCAAAAPTAGTAAACSTTGQEGACRLC